MKLLLLSILLLFLISLGQTEVSVFSSCHFDGKWHKGFGSPLKSWTKSVIEIGDNPKEIPNISKLKATYHEHKKGLILNELYSESSDVVWKRYGQNPLDGWIYGRTKDSKDENTFYKTFIYSDFYTAIQGKFSNSNVLLEGTATKVIGWR